MGSRLPLACELNCRRMLRVLSHELRGPLGVMQGYLRLLLTRRADDAADVRMLTAILDASGRITAIGATHRTSRRGKMDGAVRASRHDLGARADREGRRGERRQAWRPPRPPTRDRAPFSWCASPPRWRRRSRRWSRLRTCTEHAVRSSAAARRWAAAERSRFVRRPRRRTPRTARDEHAVASDAAGAFTFDRGGHGLALVLAGAVFDVTRREPSCPRPSPAIVLTFPLPSTRHTVNPAKLAVVDDDPAFAEYLKTLLGSRGYDVSVYSSGATLLQALERNPALDVVLLDVLMPGMNGLETLKAVRQANPAVQVIMLSGQQVPVDHRRFGPPRRRRLRRQARRSRGPRRGGARNRDPERARKGHADDRSGAPARAGRRRPGRHAAVLGRHAGDAAGPDDGRARRRQRRERAHHGRKRRRQGSHRPRTAPAIAAPARRTS